MRNPAPETAKVVPSATRRLVRMVKKLNRRLLHPRSSCRWLMTDSGLSRTEGASRTTPERRSNHHPTRMRGALIHKTEALYAQDCGRMERRLCSALGVSNPECADRPSCVCPERRLRQKRMQNRAQRARLDTNFPSKIHISWALPLYR
jgi:hypothetical protein